MVSMSRCILHSHRTLLTTLTCQEILEGDTIRDAGTFMLTVDSSHKSECQVKNVAVDKMTLGAKQHS